MVEENPHIGDQTDASHISESKKKDSTLRVLFKFYKLLFTKWRNKKKNDESKSEHKRETNLEAVDGDPRPHNKGIEDNPEEETMQGVHSFRHNVERIGVSETPTSPGGLSKRRSVDSIFPFLPSHFSRSSSRRSPSPFSRSASRRSPSPFSRSASRKSPSPTTSSLHRSISRKSTELTGYPGASPASLSRNTSRRSTTPIMFSNSTGIPVKPPAVEKKLECTLEELCFGCTKKIKITRDAITSSGQLIQDEEMLSIKVKPGWKKGTKITFEGKGNEVPGTQPADVIFVIAEKRHHLFRRDGDDLELAVEIPLVKALTGCTISVPLLGGEKMDLSIDDEIIHPGYEKMIEGQGMPTKDPEGARGNLKLLFLVNFPTELTDEQRSNVLGILEDCC